MISNRSSTLSDLERARRRITITLFAGQSLTSASVIMAATVGSIAVVELSGNRSQMTGVPSTVSVIGAALVAFPMGKLMDRTGRRFGIGLGFAFGAIGATLIGLSLIARSLPLFLAGFAVLGSCRGTVEQGRYAAGEASPPSQRARAISWVVLGGTVGSVGGPGLIQVSSKFSLAHGLPEYAGPVFAGTLLLAIGFIVINVFLRPDPQQIGRELAAIAADTSTAKVDVIAPARTYAQALRDPNIRLAVGTLMFAQVTMVVVMVVTPIHMHGHQHPLGSISLVIMAHTFGMFGLSFFTGWLADRFGRARMIVSGSVVMATACILAPVSTRVPWLSVALFLLGLGWNWCFVAGSTLLSDSLRQEERGRMQGLTDTAVNVSSATGTLVSGFAFAAIGFDATSWINIALGLMPLMFVLSTRGARRNLLAGAPAVD